MSASPKTHKIGMIGIGLMGLGIASNLQRHGYPLNILTHSGNQPVDDLLSNGANSFSSASQLAQKSDVIILCVTGSPQVEEVLYSANGVIAGLSAGKVVIDCSTSIPSSTLKNASNIAATGAAMLDAPMTRTPKEAMQGRLNLIVGGDHALYQNMRPVFECFAENITYAGPTASGHTLKLLHNFVSIGFATVLSEAAACASKAQVSPQVFVEVLAKGGGAGVILDRLRPFITDQDDSGFRFSIANSVKDIGYYFNMTQDLQASSTSAAAILETLSHAQQCSDNTTALPHLISILGQNN